MVELVAAFHSQVGLAGVLIAVAAVNHPPSFGPGHMKVLLAEAEVPDD